MNDISKHVADFEKAMTASGYTGVFTCNGAHPGKLKECLVAYLFTQLDKRKDLKPFLLTMSVSSASKDTSGNGIDYAFDVQYGRSTGFRVVKINVTDRSTDTGKDTPELHIKGTIALPVRQHINRLMSKERKGPDTANTKTEKM
ncbi:MAG TPA: hypothetical protein VK658_26565 [Chryseolinea sp.]|nr:hypothetical protein [Chryseolinea sp.]